MRAAIERKVVSTLMRLPPSWLRRLAGGEPETVDGQLLDAQLQIGIFVHGRMGRPAMDELEPADARVEFASSIAGFLPRPPAMRSIDNRDAAGVPVRIYKPNGVGTDAPLLVYFHGGGGVIGDLDSYDAPCRVLAEESGTVLISVDYRLAPEHKFPAGVDDALTAYRWVCDHAGALGGDAGRIAVGGDSMGGNFAAIVAQRANAGEAPLPAFQLLLYPMLDPHHRTRSYDTFADGYVLTRPIMDYFHDHYFAGSDQLDDPRAAPLFTENLAGLPPALMVTAGFDPLRDEGRAYADRLDAAGVFVRYRCYPTLVHGFISFTGAIKQAREAMREAAHMTREALR